MIEFTTHVDINRPPAEVFAFVLDFENAPKWNYFVTSVKKQSSGPLAIGTVYHQTRKTDQQDYQITDVDPARSVEVTTTPGSSPAFMRRFELEPTPLGTRLHDHWELQTGHHPLLERLGTRQIRTAVTETSGNSRNYSRQAPRISQTAARQSCDVAVSVGVASGVPKRQCCGLVSKRRGFCK